jgi:Peptidase family S41
MKKTTLAAHVFFAAVLLVLLSRFLWPEEALFLYLVPALVGVLVSGFIFLVVGIFRKIRLRKFLKPTYVTVLVFQTIIVAFVIWSMFPRYFDKQQVFDDIEFARLFMEDVHPDIYAETDRSEFDRTISSIKAATPEKVSEAAAHKIFSSVFAGLKDAHTAYSMNNYLSRGSILFRKTPPHRFRVLDQKLYVSKNYYLRGNIPIGSEIISINNQSAAECLEDVGRLLSFETIHNRNANLELPAFWGLWNEFGDYEITFKTPSDEVVNSTSASGLFANLAYLWDFTRFGYENYSFSVLEGNVGLMNIQAFNGQESFEDFLAKTFKTIQQENIKHLIIDIRQNSGGSTSLAEELMQYISPTEFKPFEVSLLKISKDLISRHNIDTTKFKPGTLVDEGYTMDELRENPLRFNGEVFVLTSGYTFSTALDFAAMVRCFNVGTIVGTETGGRTASFGSPQSFKLPETGVEMKVSRKKFLNPCGEESDHGIIPDHVVENSISDDMEEVDQTLAYTVSLINNR